VLKLFSALVEDHYDQKLRTIRVLLDQSQAIHHEEHEQLQKAVWEAHEEAETLRVELTAARAELQSLKNLMSSVVQKLSQGTANDLD
jgi:predicted  nucleic acid-binding Zn-ribbon protein